MRCRVDMDDRKHLLKLVKRDATCECGEPAVIRYHAAGQRRGGGRYEFEWPRCAACPGTRRTQGVYVQASPMPEKHRAVLRLLGDEEAFIAAWRLGYRPPCYAEDGVTIDGEVDIDIWDWEYTGSNSCDPT